MGLNKCNIPSLNEITKNYNEFGLEKLYKRFIKYDSWSGDTDAMNFLENKIKEYETTIDINNNINTIRM